MSLSFKIGFNQNTGEKFRHFLETGQILFVLGANGTGKSSLISLLFGRHHQQAKRISAHRQTWFVSNSLDMTPKNRNDYERSIQSQDQQNHARYQEQFAEQRAGIAIYDLIDSDTMLEREIAALVRSGEIESAQKKAETPSPIQQINELMRLSNIPIEISLEERQHIMARRSGGDPYSVVELSDGERSAFLIAAAVLTAKPNTLILIDEPERHLHRSIISPLLTLLFEKRSDCAFVVSTHEVMLPIDNPSASTLLLRDCQYENSTATSWTVDLLPPNSDMDDLLKRDILGARQKIIFVEGTKSRLDVPLYSILFPDVSVISKENCRDVENSVKSLRSAEDLHWIRAWGIVDNDGRSDSDIISLKANNIHALPFFSVEALYFHPVIIREISIRQSSVTGEDANDLYSRATNGALEAIEKNRAHLISRVVEQHVRRKIFRSFPNRDDIQCCDEVTIEIDVDLCRMREKEKFEKFVFDRDYVGLLECYPIRETGAFNRVVTEIGLRMSSYQDAVRKLVQEDKEVIFQMQNVFVDLVADVNAQ